MEKDISEDFLKSQTEIKVYEIFKSIKEKRFNELYSFHLNTAEFSKIDAIGDVILDFNKTIELEKQAFEEEIKEFYFDKRSIKDIKISVFASTTVAAFIFDYNVKLKSGSNFTIPMRGTLIFQVLKKPFNLKIVHEHFSIGFKEEYFR